MQVQEPGGLALVPLDPLQNPEHDLPLELLTGLSQRHRLGLLGSANRIGQQ